MTKSFRRTRSGRQRVRLGLRLLSALAVIVPATLTVAAVPAAASSPPTVMSSVLPTGRYQGNAASWGGYVYFVGGWDGAYLNQIVKYDPGTGLVTNVGTLPQARKDMGVVTIGSFIYIFGGSDSSLNYYNDVLKFNPATGGAATVVSGATMPSGRCCFPVVTDGSVAYLFGGWNVSIGRSNQILKFNPATNAFTTMSATLPSGRNLSAAAWHNGRAYVMGGIDGSGQLRDIVEYNPATNTVTTRGEQLPATAIDFDAISDGTAIYAVGGMSGSTKLTQILRYDPATGSVTTAANLPSGRSAMGVAYASPYVYVVGGEDQSGTLLAQIVRYGPNRAPTAGFSSTTTGTTVSVNGSLSNDPDGSISSYSWDWGDGSAASSGATASHTYACPGGTFTVRLTVVDNEGASMSTTLSVAARDPDADADGLPACRESAQGTSDSDADTDDDGLSDLVESQWWDPDPAIASITRDTVFCNASATVCAYPNPTVRDLYVELDWMSGHALRSTDASTIQSNFDNSPLNLNPNPSDNVLFHFDQGQLGGGGQTLPLAARSHISDIEALKANAGDFSPYRDHVFRYGVIACLYADGSPNVWGFGRTPGDLFAMFDCAANMSDADAQAKEFMHELGHGLLGVRVNTAACGTFAERNSSMTAEFNAPEDGFDCNGDGAQDIWAHTTATNSVMTQNGPTGKTTSNYTGTTWGALKLDFGINGTVSPDCGLVMLDDDVVGETLGGLFGPCSPLPI